MNQIVFYGINGIGLGHIVRLSVVQKHIAQHFPEVNLEAICRSSLGSHFFTCPCTKINSCNRELGNALGIRGSQGKWNLLLSRIFSSRRKTVVFDSVWSNRTLKHLRSGRHHAVAIVQVTNPEHMLQAIKEDHKYFHKIFFPCQQEELEYHYKQHTTLWELLQHDKFEAVGPIVGTSTLHDDTEKVIFTLGGGGEMKEELPEFKTENNLNKYIEAAHILKAAGKKQLYLAKGPMLEIGMDIGPLKIIETLDLPQHFGANTTVVTRGTYNLGWEAIAAGATLITTNRSGVLAEYAENRNKFLDKKQYAYWTPIDGQAIAEAILRNPPAHLEEATNLVNTQQGLKRIAETLISIW